MIYKLLNLIKRVSLMRIVISMWFILAQFGYLQTNEVLFMCLLVFMVVTSTSSNRHTLLINHHFGMS